MGIAYILVKAHSAEADRMLADLLAIDGVVSGHIVAGDADVIVKLDVPSSTDVKPIVTESIQSVAGVESTQTFLAME